jgi:hypothetical protein
MRTLTFNQPHHLGKLHDELLTIPGLQPVGEERTAVMSVSGDGQTLTLQVPDDANEAAIQSVVLTHDPTPPAPPPDPDAELDAAIEAATTLDELKAALRGMTRPAKVRARPT